jgi:hypothetical protein
MKLVYKLEIEVPDAALAQEIGDALQGAWNWLRFKGWRIKVTADQPGVQRSPFPTTW